MEVILTQLMGDRNRKKHMGVFHVYPLSTSWVLIPLFFCPVVKAVAPKPMGFHLSKNPPGFLLKQTCRPFARQTHGIFGILPAGLTLNQPRICGR